MKKIYVILLLFLVKIYLIAGESIIFNTDNSPLKSNLMRNLLVDKQDNIWIVSWYEFYKYHNGKWSVYDTLFKKDTEVRYLPIAEDSSNYIWLTFYASLYMDPTQHYCGFIKYDGFNFKIDTSINKYVYGMGNIAVDHKNNIWGFGTDVPENYKFSIVKYNGNEIKIFDITDTNNKYQAHFQIKIKNNGEVWGATSSGIMIIKDDSLRIMNKDNSNLPTNNIWDIYFLKNSKILIATDSGLIVYNDKYEIDTIYTESQDSFSLKSISHIKEDNYGNIYLSLGYDEYPYFKFDGKLFIKLKISKDEDDSFLRYPWSIDVDKNNNVWIATSMAGVAVYNDNKLILGVEDNFPISSTLESSPNPFSLTTTIKYSLPNPGKVKLVVYNALGYEAAVLVDGYKDSGAHEAVFDGSGLASGAYVYVLQAGGEIQTGKLMLIKK